MSAAPGIAAVRDHVFISYRRDDARGASGRLYDWLRIAFGRNRVFRDVHSIGVGKWRDKIEAALSRSAVCVAVIGPRWADAENLRRLHEDDGDMVRHELVKALACGEMTVAPTLVEGAGVPDSAGLPAVLRPLFEVWNARRVTEDGWEDDTRRLIAEIGAEAKLVAMPDLDTLLRDAGRISELEQVRHLQAGQIEGLRRTVEELTGKLAEAAVGERAGLAEAFAALARGDSRAAEDAFEREYGAQAGVMAEARGRSAEAARNVANLALLRDVGKAVSFYRKALEAEPEHAETARMLGRALLSFGDVRGAEAAFRRSLEIAVAQGNLWGEVAARNGLGDVFQSAGDLGSAKEAYGKGLGIREELAARDPANTGWQRDLSVSFLKIGDVLVAQGDGAGALGAYRKGLGIAEELAARDPANAEWQRDLIVSFVKLSEVTGEGDYVVKALHIAFAMQERGTLAPRDAWLVGELRRRAGLESV